MSHQDRPVIVGAGPVGLGAARCSWPGKGGLPESSRCATSPPSSREHWPSIIGRPGGQRASAASPTFAQHMEAHMALNHLNLTVPNVPQTRAFFETYFGFRCLAGAPQSDTFVVLVDESGFVLSLNNFTEAEEVVYPGAFHVGFRQDSREQVDAIYQRLNAAGFNMKVPHEFHG